MGQSTLSKELTRQFHISHHHSADSTPLTHRRSKEETVAIFDDIISQMHCASIDGPQEPPRSRSSDELDSLLENGAQMIQSDSDATGTGVGNEPAGQSVVARRVKSSDAAHSDRLPLRRTSSSTSLEKGEGPDPEHPPRAASVETELVFATLPKKKKKGRWSGIKRIGSPLFKSRRKSFTSGTTPSYAHTNHTSSGTTTQRVSITGPTPSVPVTSEHAHSAQDSPQTIVQSHTPISGLAKKTREDAPGGTSRGAPTGGRARGRRSVTSPIVMERKRRASAPRDECLKALKVMTLLSSNQECLGSLISYICLPKCVSK